MNKYRFISIYVWIYIIIIYISSVSSSSVAAPGWEERVNVPPPSVTGKYAKDWEQSTFQPAMRIDSKNNLKFMLNFSKFLLKFS